MNDSNKRLACILDPLIFNNLENMQITDDSDVAHKIDLSKTSIYLTSDPMLNDPSIRTMNKLGILARYKQIDSETIYMYAEPVCTMPQMRAILTSEVKGYGPGTRVRVLNIHSKESSLHDAAYSVELVSNPYTTFRVPRDSLILDVNAKNLYFNKRMRIRSGSSVEQALVPIARFEYYDTPSKTDAETAWNMLYALYPDLDPYYNEHNTGEIVLTHEHPTARRNYSSYDTLRKHSLQETITRPDVRDRYKDILTRNSTPASNYGL